MGDAKKTQKNAVPAGPGWISTAWLPLREIFCKRRKCLVSDAGKSQSRRIAVSKVRRFASHEVRGLVINDAVVCSPKCNMQVTLVDQSWATPVLNVVI
jgi:hypothetical protein